MLLARSILDHLGVRGDAQEGRFPVSEDNLPDPTRWEYYSTEM